MRFYIPYASLFLAGFDVAYLLKQLDLSSISWGIFDWKQGFSGQEDE